MVNCMFVAPGVTQLTNQINLTNPLSLKPCNPGFGLNRGVLGGGGGITIVPDCFVTQPSPVLCVGHCPAKVGTWTCRLVLNSDYSHKFADLRLDLMHGDMT